MTIDRFAVTLLGCCLLCGASIAQEPEPATTVPATTVPDLRDAARTAVEHPRYAVRRAAAGKVALAGDAAVPALRALEAEIGRARIPLVLVDAVASSTAGGEALAGLIESWATDVEFYWRAQSLGGLALRAVDRAAPLFRRAIDDPSHLFRIEGARGLLAIGAGDADSLRVRSLLADEDPRCRLRVALMLLEHGDAAGVGEIVAAVRRAGRRFVDDPWGEREALFALRELRRIRAVDATAAIGSEPTERAAALDALIDFAKTANPLWDDRGDEPEPPPTIGGLEVRSCRHGDAFVRWTADGSAVIGLSPFRTVGLDGERFAALQRQLTELGGVATHGEIVCDYVRLLAPAAGAGDADVHHKAAPRAVPEAFADWLKALAAALDEAGSAAVTAGRLEQFVPSGRD